MSRIEKSRILIIAGPNGAGKATFAAYLPDTSYCNTLLHVLKLRPNVKIDYKYLLGILNSRFIGWFFRKKFQIAVSDTFPQIMISDIHQFPIPEISSGQQKHIVVYVDKIIDLAKSDDYLQNQTKQAKVKEYESEIDQMVYDLTPEEIAIVEGKATK